MDELWQAICWQARWQRWQDKQFDWRLVYQKGEMLADNEVNRVVFVNGRITIETAHPTGCQGARQ